MEGIERHTRSQKRAFYYFLFRHRQSGNKARNYISWLSECKFIHPREVFEPAVKNLAAQVILAHNHPSGDPEPSENDLKLNKRLVEAGRILGIEVIDHIIVTRNGYLSFKKRGLI